MRARGGMTNDECRMTKAPEAAHGARFVICHSSFVIAPQPASLRQWLRNIVALAGAWTLLLILLALGARVGAEEKAAGVSVIVAVGAGGEQAYADAFAKWAADWKRACDAGGARSLTIGLAGDAKAAGQEPDNAPSDRARIESALAAERRDGAEELWVVLLGHGTADAKESKFNLRGDDLTLTDLAAWLKPFTRPVVVVCAFSASGVWLKPLSGSGRAIVTATKSASENNYSRFGGHLAQAIGDPAADIDKDGETSLLEAWLTAARKTADFYKDEGRIATEHSLLDDNGDGLGTPPDWFAGVRLVKRGRDGKQPDGPRAAQIHLVHSDAERALTAEQRAQRDALERDLAALRDRKAEMKEDEYLRELEALLLRIARIYQGGS